MEDPAFPSDTYAIKTQIRHHGLDPKDALLSRARAKANSPVGTEDIVDLIEKNRGHARGSLDRQRNFFTGQLFDIPTITKAAQKHGVTVGVDLAHAVGNVSLAMHDWNVDFAVWCSTNT